MNPRSAGYSLFVKETIDSLEKPAAQSTSMNLRRKLSTMAGALLLAGCSTPDLRLVSKPAMQFGDARAFAAISRTAAQLEPGRVVTGGAQASVCAYCR